MAFDSCPRCGYTDGKFEVKMGEEFWASVRRASDTVARWPGWMKGISVQYGVERCPHCDASLIGEMVPVERCQTIGATHYNRGRYCYGSTDHDPEYLVCPDCKKHIKF